MSNMRSMHTMSSSVMELSQQESQSEEASQTQTQRMQSSGSVAEDNNQQVFDASVRDLRYFAALLRGVSFANRATFLVSPGGLEVTVEESRSLLATAYITNDVFEEYIYKPPVAQNPEPDEDGTIAHENIVFEVSLNILLESLNIFGTAGNLGAQATANNTKRWRRTGDEPENEQREAGRGQNRENRDSAPANGRIDQYFGGEKGAGVRISYAGAGYPLTLLIAESTGGPTATCEITTFDPEAQLDLPFDVNETILKIILKSSWLREALSEIDTSCDKLTIIGNPPPADNAPRASTQPRLRLKAVGTLGSIELDYPNDREVLETCECESSVTFSYNLKHILKALRALANSTKTSLRIDEEGLLSLQFLMPSPRGRTGGVEQFIEFRCLPLEEPQ